MPKMLCFCVFDCVGTDMKEKDKTEPKSTTRARDLERVLKAGAGKHFSSIDPNYAQMVLKESKIVKNSHWINLQIWSLDF